jgi:hypothetical protein
VERLLASTTYLAGVFIVVIPFTGKSTMLPDGNGGWQVGETTESTIREDGKNRTSDGRISRRHSDGNCHGFCGQSQASGQNTSTVETHRWASVLENYFGRGLVDASSKKSAVANS